MSSSWLARQAIKGFDGLLSVLSKPKVQAAVVGASGISVLENHLPPLKRLNKTATIRLSYIDEFEKDLFSDLDLLRFIKIVIPITSINPLSLVTDIGLRMVYTLDMITDIRHDTSIEKYSKYLADASISALASIARDSGLFTFENDNSKTDAVFNFTIFTNPEDMIWPDILWAYNTMANITESPYYLSKELLEAYADCSVEGDRLIIKY